MHWEALKMPDHPDEPADVMGQLSDIFLLRNGKGARQFTFTKMRIVDLVRAALEEGKLKAPEGAPSGNAAGEEPHQEDGVLSALCQQHQRVHGNPNAAAESDTANVLSMAMDFARTLSDHWPVVVQVLPSSN